MSASPIAPGPPPDDEGEASPSDADATLAERLRANPEEFDPDLAYHIVATDGGETDAPISAPTNLFRPTVFARDDTRAGGGRIAAHYLGLIGPVPSLPDTYTHAAIGERKKRSAALFDFLEIFSGRLRELHVAAHRKYRLPSLFQLYRAGTGNAIARMVLALLGFGTERSRDLSPIDPEVVLFNAGLFADQRRTAIGLERLLADFLGLPVRVEQFRARRLTVRPEEQTRLGADHGENAILGRSALAGATAIDRRGAIRLRIGPVRYAQYLALLPDGALARQVAALARLYAGPSIAFDIQIVLVREDVPRTRLDHASPVGRLGWDTWAIGEAATDDSDETVFEPSAMEAGRAL